MIEIDESTKAPKKNEEINDADAAILQTSHPLNKEL